MNYAAIKKNDIANGSGVRVSLFVSGCRHHCPGCFNPEAQDFSYGEPFDDSVAAEVLEACEPGHISGLTLLGGDPFEPENRVALVSLAAAFKEKYPQKTLWCYTGYTFDGLLKGVAGGTEGVRELLSLLDVLVDGPFVESLKKYTQLDLN